MKRWRFPIRVPFEVLLLAAAFWMLPWLLVLLNPDYWRIVRNTLFPWCAA